MPQNTPICSVSDTSQQDVQPFELSSSESNTDDSQDNSNDERMSDLSESSPSDPINASTPSHPMKTRQIPMQEQRTLTLVPPQTPSTSQSDTESIAGPIDFSLISEMSRLSTPPPLPTQEDNAEPSLSNWHGFKVVGDNVDKTIKPRHMREDRQTKSVHYFQIYAVEDRVNLSESSEEPRVPGQDPPLNEILPSPEDNRAMIANLTTIVTRILAEHVPFIKENLGDAVARHIPHPYSSEMAKKSNVVSMHAMSLLGFLYLNLIYLLQVPLGVLLQNETKYDDMISILDHVHQYVPTVRFPSTKEVPQSSESEHVEAVHMNRLPFGGDQLTSKRCRGSQRIRSNSIDDAQRLQGVVATAEDWHTKLCLLTVSKYVINT